MDKRDFKSKLVSLLQQDVMGIPPENKIKYMKKWIREYELQHQTIPGKEEIKESTKVGILVQSTMRKIIRGQLLTDDKVRLLQDMRYCKTTFDINFPLLKKVVWNVTLSEQKKINGYNRYWADEEIINGEKYLICSQWYERNKPRFIKWVKEFEKTYKS